jgi:5,10-methylenetetrahydromethanopterin reductase
MEPVAETAAMARASEDAGFDAFWIAEAYPWWRKHGFEARSSTAILAVIAGQTRRIQLGWGIISPYTRHPVQVAMEARVMQDLAGDRFLLGLGASKIFMKEIGEGEGEKVGPATVMRESIEIIKGVLEGHPFEYQGKVFAAAVPGLKTDAHGEYHDTGLRALLAPKHGSGCAQSGQGCSAIGARFGHCGQHRPRFGQRKRGRARTSRHVSRQ